MYGIRFGTKNHTKSLIYHQPSSLRDGHSLGYARDLNRIARTLYVVTAFLTNVLSRLDTICFLKTPPPFIQSACNLEELGVQRGSSPNNQDSVPVSHERNKRTRKPLQLQRRLVIIGYWDASEDKSMAALSRMFEIPRSTAYGIIKDRETLK